jgi:GTPase
MNRLPTVAIVGRPNIGKSSLFNIMLGRRMAIVHSESGVTRDRIISPVSHQGHHFQVADTGGLGTFKNEKKKQGAWDASIRKQVEAAIESADLILCLTDITEGLTPLDKDIIKSLRASGRPTMLVANKADTVSKEALITDFAATGVDDIFSISCLHRRGIGILMDAILTKIDASPVAPEEIRPLQVAVVGRPNVGKSSIINRFLGENRVMVSNIAGTTRDAVDISATLKYNSEEIPVTMVDTAGLRKKGRANTAVEVFSIMRAESAIKRADIILLVIEADEYGVTSQDKKIAKLIETSGKGCIIIANKWDLCEELTEDAAADELRYSLKFLQYAPVVFTSAINGYNFDGIIEQIIEVKDRINMRIPTPLLNRIITDACLKTPPAIIGKRSFKIYYTTMIDTAPPVFRLFVNNPTLCQKNYISYLNNVLRTSLDFTGWPIELQLKKRYKPSDDKKIAKPFKQDNNKRKSKSYKGHKKKLGNVSNKRPAKKKMR